MSSSRALRKANQRKIPPHSVTHLITTKRYRTILRGELRMRVVLLLQPGPGYAHLSYVTSYLHFAPVDDALDDVMTLSVI